MEKRAVSLGRALTIRVPREIAEVAGVVPGDVLFPRIQRQSIMYAREYQTGCRSIAYRSKDQGIPVLGIAAEHARDLGIVAGTLMDISVHKGTIRMAKV